MKKVIGYLMILTVLAGLVWMMLATSGIKDTLIILGVSVLVGIFIGVAVGLINSD